MRTILAIFIIFLVSAGHANARPHGGVPGTAVTCPQAIDNGCAAANQSAQVIFPSFFTTVRQSGQAQYKASGGAGSNHPPNFNVAGVDYPVGAITADASLADPLLHLSDAAFTGCSYSAASHTITCGNGAKSFSSFRWNGIALYVNNNDSSSLSFTDNHMTLTADNCRNYNGSGNLRQNGGAMTVTNNTFDFDTGCTFSADLYKTASDPGLTTQASFTGSIATNTLAVSSSSTGKIRIGQYVDFPSRSTKTQITAITSPAPVTISSITISGNIATVTTATPHGLDVGAGITMNNQTPTAYRGDAEVLSVPDSTHFTYQIPYYNTPPGSSASSVGTYSISYLSGASANGSTWTVSGTATAGSGSYTTGPVLATFNGPMTGGNQALTATYNAILGAGQFIGTGTSGNVTAKYNYEEILTQNGQHVNFIFNTPPGSPISVDFTMSGNTIWWNPYAEDGGTGTLDLFTSSAAASDGGPFTVNNFNVEQNVVIANSSIPNSSTNTAALVRTLGQKGSGPDIKYTMTGGVLTVTQFSAGTTPTSINAGNVVQCVAAGCTMPIQFIAQLTGTGGAPCPDVTCTGGIGTYSVTSTDVVNGTATTFRVSNYNGTIVNTNVNRNYFDATGANSVYFFDNANTWVTNPVSTTGNVNMLNGNSCNVGGSC